jgi:hypothetical protein
MTSVGIQKSKYKKNSLQSSKKSVGFSSPKGGGAGGHNKMYFGSSIVSVQN